MAKTYSSWLLRLIGPFLFILFLLNTDIEGLFHVLRGADLWLILLALVLFFPFLIVKSWRWQRILHEFGLIVSFPFALAIYSIGIFLSTTTPAQSGDMAKAWYLHDRGYAIAPALLSTVLDRLFDLLVVAFLALVGLLSLRQMLPFQEAQIPLVVATGMTLVIVTGVLLLRAPRQWLLTRVFPMILPRRLHTRLQQVTTQLATLALHPGLIVPIGGATIISAGLSFFRLWLLFIALGVFMPPLVVVGTSALIFVLQMLPISIAGIGIRDAVLIAVVGAYGYSQEQALGVAALFLVLTLQQLLVGFVVSLWYPLGKTKSRLPSPY